MQTNKSTLPLLISAGGGGLLFLSLFLAWLSVGPADASAWETFSIVDILLAAIALLAAVIAGALATGTELPIPLPGPELLKWLGVIGTTIVLTFILEGDNLGFGVFLGLLGALGILAGAVLRERPDLAARVGAGPAVQPSARPPSGVRGGATEAVPSPGAAPVGESAGAVQPATGAGGATAGAVTPAAGAAAADPAQSSGPPAGWYPDPQGQARLRYWDGSIWTDQTSA